MSEQTTPTGPSTRAPTTAHGTNAGGPGAIDTVWVVASVVLLVGGLVAYYWLGTSPMAVRAGAVIGGLALAVGAFAMSAYGRQLWQFVMGSRVELRKMVWPNMNETRTITLIVFAFVFALGLFFWVVDWFLAWGTRHLLGTGV
jgi:preprotein translocase subunit SecE